MAHPFRDDYATLGLEDNADWASAQVQYRRQVNRWHPDRFARQPRERLHAEKRFIQLTKAFERIRLYYRTNSRLPLEVIDKDLSVQEATCEWNSADMGTSNSLAMEIERPDFRKKFYGEAGSSGSNSPKASLSSSSAGSAIRLLIWLVPGVMVVATGVAFVVLDRHAQRASLEEARKHLIEQVPSNFMPSASEIHNRNSRGAFVEREESGNMGDMLMPDVFR